jgi:hypothetical protein
MATTYKYPPKMTINKSGTIEQRVSAIEDYIKQAEVYLQWVGEKLAFILENGETATFTNGDGDTVTVEDGIITDVS